MSQVYFENLSKGKEYVAEESIEKGQFLELTLDNSVEKVKKNTVITANRLLLLADVSYDKDTYLAGDSVPVRYLKKGDVVLARTSSSSGSLVFADKVNLTITGNITKAPNSGNVIPVGTVVEASVSQTTDFYTKIIIH